MGLEMTEAYNKMREVPFQYAVMQMVGITSSSEKDVVLILTKGVPDPIPNFVSSRLPNIQSETELLYLKESALIIFAGKSHTIKQV